MKIGIVCNPLNVDIVPKYDKINYIKLFRDELRKNHNVYLFDWRNVDKNLSSSEAYFNDSNSLMDKLEDFDISQCSVIFVKQLGKIHESPKEFKMFLKYLRSFKGRVLNPVETIEANLSKEYLLSLQENGFPVIPTKRFDKNLSLSEAKKISFGENFSDLVIKPLYFGEQGQGVRLLSTFSNEEFEKYKKEHSDLIIQPLIKDIFSQGEISLVFFGKDFYHSVKKFSGEFKINASEKTICERYFPTKEELQLAKKILDFWPNDLGYTRIDIIPFNKDFLVSEVETVNPAFYIENVVDLCSSFMSKFEKFLIGK